MMGNPRKIW